MAKIILGNRDGKDGRNKTYTIPGRGVVTKKTAIKEVKKGKHPNHIVSRSVKGLEFIKSKPNSSSKDNVNRY